MGDARRLAMTLHQDHKVRDTTTRQSDHSMKTPEDLYNEVMDTGRLSRARGIPGVPLPQPQSLKPQPVEQPPSKAATTIDVPPLNTSCFYSLLASKFDALDLNHDQILDKNEIQFAAQTQKLSPAQGVMMASLVKNLRYYQFLHHDSWFEFGEMMSLNDMRDFHELQARVTSEIQDARKLETLGSSKFAEIDGDKDGFLTKPELDQYSNSTKDNKEKEIIAHAKAKFDDIEEANNDEWFDEDDGITKQDLTKYREALESTDEAKAVINLNNEVNSHRDNLLKASLNLYGDLNNPVNSITADAIKPGSFYNSTFESWLRDVARRDPGYIWRAIKPNEDGSYTVTLPDASPSRAGASVWSVQKPIVVTDYDRQIETPAPTTAELAMYTNGGAYGIWPAVFAKAFGRYMERLQQEQIHRIYNDDYKYRDDEQQAIDNSESGLRGKKAEHVATAMAMESVKKFQDTVTVYKRLASGEVSDSAFVFERDNHAPNQNGSMTLKWDPGE